MIQHYKMIHVPAAEIEAAVETTAMLSKKSAANRATLQVDLNLIKESISGPSPPPEVEGK